MDKTYIIDGSGTKREAVLIECTNCGTSFLKLKRFLKNGGHFFCTRKCAGEQKHKQNTVDLTCNSCNIVFNRHVSKVENSKSGLYFCSRKCKDAGQKLENGLVDLQPNHYGTAKVPPYRELAFMIYDHACEACGQNFNEGLLEVHHIDSNRRNNNIHNLIILCPICHRAITLKYATLENRIFRQI